MQSQCDTAVFAVLFAVAVAGVVELVDSLAVEGNESQSVRNEFVGKNGCVGFDLDKVNSDGWHLGLDNSSQPISEREVRPGQLEVDMC